VPTDDHRDSAQDIPESHLRFEAAVREAMECKLREMVRKYRGVVELIADLVYERYVEEDVTLWFEDSLARLGYKPRELGATWQDFLLRVHPEDRDRVTNQITAVLQRNDSYDLEYRFMDAGGSYRWMRDRASVDRGGHGTRLFGVMVDVTETRVRERDIETLNRIMREKAAQLETANRELESFSYSVSHDLRAPLRAIASFVEILAEDYQHRLDDEGRHYLEIIGSNVSHMNELIRDLLAFSRLTRQPLTKDTVDMNALAAEAFSQLKPKDAHVEWKLDRLPEAYGDARMLRQVWTNLVSNALKYSRESNPPRIHVSSLQEAGRTVYVIQDNGVGFDESYQDKLFAVFQRLHVHKSFEGTGVGLSIVQRIIQRHSGRIWARSTPGEGAAFYFYLA
jgi:signal transduction histidine kinase